MEATFVNVDELRLGKVIAEDIFANTQYPIVYKNTKINYEHIQILKAFQIHKIPVLIDSIMELQETDVEIEQEQEIDIPQAKTYSFEHYYNDAITLFQKDFRNWEAGARIDITKVRNSMLPLIEYILENRQYIYKLADYSIPKDYMYHHCVATGLIAAVIAQKIGLDKGTCIQMAIAGTLADSGMAKIPAKIREKKGTLVESEFNEIRKHPLYSYQLVKDLPAMKAEMKEAILKHHERIDGSGYPLREKIASEKHYSQIIAVADVFHAMTTERLYRSKQSPFKVVEMIKEEEFGKYDIQVVQALLDLVVDLPIGTQVELSNLERGEVIFNNQYAPTRPMVRLITSGDILDLASVRSFHIARILDI